MKVKNLIAKLSSLEQDLDVVCYLEDEETSQILDLVDISTSEAEKMRGDDGRPSLRFGKTKYSEQVVLLEITKDL